MFTHTSSGRLKWDAALAASRTADRKYYITSPNCNYVPEPIVGRVVVAMQADYRYGPPDPIQWPQVLSERFEYLCAVPRRVPNTDPRTPIWADPQQADFKLIEGCEFKTLGLFTNESLKPLVHLVQDLVRRIARRSGPSSSRLRWLDAAMRQSCDRLHRFPSTYRDACVQWRETQRYWLMATAFMDYERIMAASSTSVAAPVRKELMGAFTTHAHVVQKLFAAGIPVWFIRTDASVMGLHLSFDFLVSPSAICSAFGPGGGYELYSGLSGSRHIQATARGGHTYIDVSHAPLLAVYEDGGYAPPATQKCHEEHAQPAPSTSSSRSRGIATRPASSIQGHRNHPCKFISASKNI